MASIEIHAARSVSGNQPGMARIIEEATQTFLSGTPVMLASGDGGVKAWDGTTLAAGIAGFSKEDASNLATVGVPKTLSFGSVPNQSAAVNIPRAAPFNDGKIGFEVASDDNVFKGQIGPSVTTTPQMVGVAYGLTKDSDGHWYVDTTKTGVNSAVTVVGLDPLDTLRGVFFVVLRTAQQIPA